MKPINRIFYGGAIVGVSLLVGAAINECFPSRYLDRPRASHLQKELKELEANPDVQRYNVARHELASLPKTSDIKNEVALGGVGLILFSTLGALFYNVPFAKPKNSR